jgi:hypothetical protein
LKLRIHLPAILFGVIAAVLPVAGQQKGQYVPGQYGLNAGILPDPGFTYANLEINYSADTVNGPNGKSIAPNAKGNLNIWIVENILEYVVNTKFLGGNLGFMIIVPTVANGSLTLEDLNKSGSTFGFADTWAQPFTLGWHLKRADIQVADAFMTPTGRYSPGALNNIGSGYFGNHVTMGVTGYLTKNKGTSANIFTDWEVHGYKEGTHGTAKSPGQTFTDEWGLGQVLPLKKNLSQLLQVGAIGYDQWQITDNGGTVAVTGPLGNTIILPAKTLPYYSVHAVGGQLNYILPARHLALFFKFEHEYSSYSTTLGNTLVFGGSWTLCVPKPAVTSH